MFIFGDTFEFSVTSKKAALSVFLFDKDVSRFASSDILGKALIPLLEFKNKKEVEKNFDLVAPGYIPIPKKKVEAAGSVRLRISFEVDEYFASVSDSEVYGVPLDAILSREKGTVPLLVLSCTAVLRKRGFNSVGLFRLAGLKSNVDTLKASINNGTVVDFDKIENENDIGDLLKSFLRELPEPLYTFAHYIDFLEAAKLPEADMAVKFKELLAKLPRSHVDLLRHLFDFLREITALKDLNKMTNMNVGICFNPNLLRCTEEQEKLQDPLAQFYLPNVTEKILDHYDEVFPKL
jgi:hypothetical protein